MSVVMVLAAAREDLIVRSADSTTLFGNAFDLRGSLSLGL
jgi:hypothetical protein